MFLGKYLVNESKVSEKNLIEAMCLQMESTPSLLRLAVEDGLVDDKEAIELVSKSINEKKSFYQILTENKSGDQEKINKILAKQAEKRKGLVELLTSIDAISIDEYEKSLSSYFAHKPNDEVASENTSTSETEEVEISSVALDALKELEGIGDPDEISALESKIASDSSLPVSEKVEPGKDKGKDNQFVKSFSEEKFHEFRNYCELLTATSQVELLEEFQKYFHTLVGICRFENLSLLERYFTDLENHTVKAHKRWSEEKISSTFPELMTNSIELIWNMRKAVYETGREVEAFTRPELKTGYLNINKSLSSLLGI